MNDNLKKVFGDSIILGNGLWVSVEKIAELFSDAEDFSYDELMRIEKENGYGYEKYIKKWKEEGLIE